MKITAMTHREKKLIALIITTNSFKVHDLEFTEEEATKLHDKLGEALQEFKN